MLRRATFDRPPIPLTKGYAMWFFAFIAIVIAEAIVVGDVTDINDNGDDSGMCAG